MYHSDCANPPDLRSMVFIDTAASVTLPTPTAPACNKTNNNVQITVLQPSGAKMTSTHAVKLLLNKLPADTRLAHRLPGLVNNLLSVAVLCDAGCEVFFHKHGCKVTHTGETILRGWRNPKNRLWRVKLVDDGWTTKLTICDDATPPPTAPTGIAMAAPTTNMVEEAQTNSLYKCSNTYQLIYYYCACLNYPVPSSLLQATDCGYFRGWRC